MCIYFRLGSIDMICFGLGRISSSDSAAIQFSLLLHLQETLSPSIELVECFDPLFGKNEINICHKFNISVYGDNSRGIFKANGGRVLFYMPHCPYRLYSNVIWSHREHLSNICILGNR